MKKILALIFCLTLLSAMLLPVAATEATEATAQAAAPDPGNGSHVLAVVCLVVVIVGGIYLYFTFKRSGRNR